MQRRFVHLNGKNYLCTGVPVMWIYKQKEGTIILDPTVSVTKDDIGDTWIAKGAPNNNYGTHTLLLTGANTSSKVRSLLKFSLSSIPSNAPITSSKIKLYFHGYYPSSSTSTLKCYQLKKNWIELETTWINSTVSESGSTPWHVQGVGLDNIDAKSTPEDAITINDVIEWKTLNITALTQKWINGEATNYGVLLVDTEEDNGTYREKRYRSRDYSGTTYDPKLEVVYHVDGPLAQYQYDNYGRITKVTYDDGSTENNTYDNYRGWLTERTNKDPMENTIFKIENSGIDNVGNITQQKYTQYNTSTVTCNYTYDNLNQLKTFSGGGNSRSYAYDDNGNITTFGNNTYTYSGYTNKLSSDGTNTYSYDEIGRVEGIDIPGVYDITIDYDLRSNMILYNKYSNTMNCAYDAFNERVFRKMYAAGSEVFYITSGPQILAEYSTDANLLAEYVYGANGMMAKFKPSTGYYWFYKDQVGSTRQLGKTASGSYSSQERRDYYPYGELTQSAGDETSYTYTGKEHHSSIGLTYFGRRYYDPSLGRWLTPDPMHQFYSPYVYCANNPMMCVDSDGQWVGILIGMYLSGLMYTYIDNPKCEGILNPLNWNWEDPMLYIAVISGGIAGGRIEHQIFGDNGTGFITKLYGKTIKTFGGNIKHITPYASYAAIAPGSYAAYNYLYQKSAENYYWNKLFGEETSYPSFDQVFSSMVPEMSFADYLKAMSHDPAFMAEYWQYAPYKWGGTEWNGFDCSGFDWKMMEISGIYQTRGTANTFPWGPGWSRVSGDYTTWEDFDFLQWVIDPVGHMAMWLNSGPTGNPGMWHSKGGAGVTWDDYGNSYWNDLTGNHGQPNVWRYKGLRYRH